MRAAIHQPNFVPRLKVLQKITQAEVWVVQNVVQYAKQEWQNRTWIVPTIESHAAFWLTIPVTLPSRSSTRICDVEVADPMGLMTQFRRRLVGAFKGAPYKQEVINYWEEIMSDTLPPRLEAIATKTMAVALRRYARLPPMQYSTSLRVEGAKSQLVANICRAIGATEYIADSGARAYLNLDDFADIDVLWQDWDGQAIEADLHGWRDTGFINALARWGPNWLHRHLSEMRISANSTRPKSRLVET